MTAAKSCHHQMQCRCISDSWANKEPGREHRPASVTVRQAGGGRAPGLLQPGQAAHCSAALLQHGTLTSPQSAELPGSTVTFRGLARQVGGVPAACRPGIWHFRGSVRAR